MASVFAVERQAFLLPIMKLKSGKIVQESFTILGMDDRRSRSRRSFRSGCCRDFLRCRHAGGRGASCCCGGGRRGRLRR